MLEEGVALSSLFASKAEEHAFFEARYHCRIVVGELGEALDVRATLIASSLALGARYRMLSGLLVASELPLTLGDVEGAAASMQPVLAALAEGDAETLNVRAHAAAACLAIDSGDRAAAALRIAALEALAPQRNEEQVWVEFARCRSGLAFGSAGDLQTGLRAPRDDVPPDTWACYLAAVLAIEAAAGGVTVATLDAAERELDGGMLPPLSALIVIDALVAGRHGAHWHAEGRRLVQALRQSLAAHRRELALFEQRFRRLA
jgi:hypothetical protein